MSQTTTSNGKPQRKQLGDQLDRLDDILDLLAEGLPGAVADACREGARAAVKDALIEVLTNPELRALLAPTPAPTPVMPSDFIAPPPAPRDARKPKPGVWSRIKSKATAAKATVVGAAVRARESVADRCKAARDAVTAVGNAAGESVPVKQISFVALGVGIVVGVACLLAPHATAAVVSTVTAATTAVAVQAGSWLKRAARRVGLLT